MSILMGIGIGAFRKINLGRALAVSQVKDALRAARLFAVEQSAASRVEVDLDNNRLVATGLSSVGNWHFEDERGWPTPAVLTGGAEILADGAVGRGLWFAEDAGGSASLGRSPSFDVDDGFLVEVFVKIAEGMAAPVVSKGRAFQLSVTADLGVEVKVRTRERGEPIDDATAAPAADGPGRRPGGAGDADYRTLSLARCINPGRWTRVGAAYDGHGLRLFVNGRQRAVTHNEELLPHWPDPEGEFRVGSSSPQFVGGVDELRLAGMTVFASEPLPEGVAFARRDVVEFDGRGRLDPSHHAEPATLTLTFGESGVREVVVGLMGEVQ